MRRLAADSLRYLFAVLFVTTAIGKLLDNRGFAGVLGTYRLFPEALLMPLALSISLAELYLGARLARGRGLWAAALVTLIVNCGYFLLATITYGRGIALTNCGCFGVFFARPLTGWTLVEDAALVLLSVGFLTATARRKADLTLVPKEQIEYEQASA